MVQAVTFAYLRLLISFLLIYQREITRKWYKIEIKLQWNTSINLRMFYYNQWCKFEWPVSAWVGDRLWMGKAPRRRTRHISLSPPYVVRLQWVPGKSSGSKQAYRVIHQSVYIRGLAVFANAWLEGWLACWDQRRRTGSGSALKALRDDALYKYILLYFTYFTSVTLSIIVSKIFNDT